MVLELPILDNLDGFVRSDFFTCHISLTKILLRMFLPYVFLWLDMLVFAEGNPFKQHVGRSRFTTS